LRAISTEGDRGQARARQHELPFGHAPDQNRQGKRIDNAAETEPRNDDAGVRRTGLTADKQQQRHKREQAVDDDAFEEHRAEAELGARIGQHTLKSGKGGLQVERLRLGSRQIAKCEIRNDRDQEAERADAEEHTAPSEQIADDAGYRRADQIAGETDRKQAADHDLTFMHRHKIADDRHADRKDAARENAGDHAHDNKQRKVAGERADERCHHDDRETHIHQSGLAEEISDGAERRLHDGVWKRESGRQQRRGLHVHAHVGRNFGNDRIDGAREQRRGEHHQADDSEDRRNGGVSLFLPKVRPAIRLFSPTRRTASNAEEVAPYP
jgi:hypothetical protein